ncbi:unnamed protein product [Rotaria magnacalcarata]|uniref:Uncharacterized protein n=1 Tax=Rotaria magnacalcarata TaxID=392030 RepID=A0A816SSM6_9BILA|nr:unnamed protein product [Rotaria magnacalcarata]
MMGSTAFLSMWMNNTAPTSIMLPVALAVVHELGIHSENSPNRQQAAVINSGNHDWKYEPIVTWTQLEQNVSWGSILLLGAGLTIATAFEKSKLSDSVAQILGFASGVPRAAASIIIIIVSRFFTEVTSNKYGQHPFTCIGFSGQ